MDGSFKRRVLLAILVGAAVLVGTAMCWLALIGPADDSRPLMFLEIHPVRMPPATAAAAAPIPDEAPVIGVSAGGRHRAYTLAAFVEIDLHVRNDLLGGVPVTVAHCPRSGCTRVFTDPVGEKPLAIANGGWAGEPGESPNGVMLLRLGMDHFYHDTGEHLGGSASLPYPQADFEQTTWGQWRRAHPDSDIVAVLDALSPCG